ncbi:hypothetical protein C0989_005833 [Termitomyces sp. Mn162]|nr:hypothetical protein C0989_005833 [Termitomyces sp. Mn162]
MKLSSTIVVTAWLGSATLVSAAPRILRTRVATNLGKGLAHAAEFANTIQFDRRDLEERNLAHKLGNAGKTAVHAAGGGSAVAQHLGVLVNAYENYEQQNPVSRRELNEQEELGLLFRDLEEHLVERGWDEELDVLRRDFGDLLAERDLEEEIDVRDLEKGLDARNFDESVLDARDFADELDARDFEIDELD